MDAIEEIIENYEQQIKEQKELIGELYIVNHNLSTRFCERMAAELQNERLAKQRHIYKVELGRCQRKLAKINSLVKMFKDDISWHVYTQDRLYRKIQFLLKEIDKL